MALLLEQGVASPTGRVIFRSRSGTKLPKGWPRCARCWSSSAANPAALGSETPPVLAELREYERVLRKTARPWAALAYRGELAVDSDFGGSVPISRKTSLGG